MKYNSCSLRSTPFLTTSGGRNKSKRNQSVINAQHIFGHPIQCNHKSKKKNKENKRGPLKMPRYYIILYCLNFQSRVYHQDSSWNRGKNLWWKVSYLPEERVTTAPSVTPPLLIMQRPPYIQGSCYKCLHQLQVRRNFQNGQTEKSWHVRNCTEIIISALIMQYCGLKNSIFHMLWTFVP